MRGKVYPGARYIRVPSDLADAARGGTVRPERRTLTVPLNPWLAVDTGTVPTVRARQLKQAWEEYISDGEPPEVREPIADSWR